MKYIIKIDIIKREWWLNGKRHREDGPAIEWADGDKVWFLNDKRHREDGPAIEGVDGYKAWYLNGLKQKSHVELCNHSKLYYL